MSSVATLALALFAFAVPAPALEETPSQPTADAASYETLNADFEAELAEWKARVRAADGARERAAARRENPAPRYEEAFERLADAGEVRAVFWLLDHLSDLGGRLSERKERRLALYERMLREHAGSELLVEGVHHMHADSRFVKDQGIETVERMTREAMRTLDSDAARDSALFGLARLSSKSRAADSTEKAVALLDEILEAKRLPARELKQATKLRFRLLHLRVGCEAPDFEGSTVDGDPVRLSDHRGKVVVLDFFGFW